MLPGQGGYGLGILSLPGCVLKIMSALLPPLQLLTKHDPQYVADTMQNIALLL